MKEAQVGAFLLVLVLSWVYLVHVKPFEAPISNIMVVMNEGLLLLIGLLMISFMEDSLKNDSLPKIIIYILSANIIICFALALSSQIYSVWKKFRKNKAVKLDKIIRIKPSMIKAAKTKSLNSQIEISKLLIISDFNRQCWRV